MKHIKAAIYEMPSAVLLGVMTSLFFGLMIILNTFFAVNSGANSFFSSYPEWLRISVAIMLLVFGILSFIFPKSSCALIATYLICTANSTDAIFHSGNLTRIGYWIIIASVATWGKYEKSHFVRIPESKNNTSLPETIK